MSEDNIDMAAKDLWERAKRIFLSTLMNAEDKSRAERYIDMVTSVSNEEGVFVLLTSNEYTAEFLTENYSEKLKSSFVLAGSSPEISLKFKVDENAKSRIVPVAANPMVKETIAGGEGKGASPFISTIPLKEEYTFAEFVQGPSNSFALSAAKAVAKKPGKQSLYNPLFIHGGTGLGKTHLMQAIGNEVKKNYPSLSVCYLTTETFLNEYINSLQNGQIHAFRYKYRNIDLMLIDDVQFLNRGKENFQEEFFNTFYELQQKQKQIVMTSDVSPSKLSSIQERLISRFQGGMVQEIESPSYETRLAILRKKAESLDIKLPDQVLEYVATNVTSHVRAMEGALVKLNIVKTSDPTIILTNDILSHVLKDVIEKERTKINLTVEQIQLAVAKHYNVSIDDILSAERSQSLVTPRQMAMFLSRKLVVKSLKEIAMSFKKSHATILHGVKTMEHLIETDSSIKQSLEYILSSFGYNISDITD